MSYMTGSRPTPKVAAGDDGGGPSCSRNRQRSKANQKVARIRRPGSALTTQEKEQSKVHVYVNGLHFRPRCYRGVDQSLNGNSTRLLGVSCRETLWRFRRPVLPTPTYEAQASSISEEKLEADATEKKKKLQLTNFSSVCQRLNYT